MPCVGQFEVINKHEEALMQKFIETPHGCESVLQ